MIGEIKEKSSSKPRPLPMTKASTAVPSILPLSFSRQKPVVQETDERINDAIDYSQTKDENALIIENMSQDEIQAALEEVHSLLSAKNIAFLKNKGKPDVVTNITSPNLAPPAPLLNQPFDSKLINEPQLDSFARFDLQGRRVIEKQSLIDEMCAFISKVYEDSNNLVTVAEELFTAVINAGICYNFVSPEDPDSADLFNHEFSPDSPGYDIREICEVY